MTVIYALGAEEATVSTQGGGLWNNNYGTNTASTVQYKNGTNSYRFYQAGSATSYLTRTIPSSGSLAASMYVYFATFPTSDAYIFRPSVSGSYPTVYFYKAGTVLISLFNGIAGGGTSAPLRTGEWYLVDFAFDKSSGTQTVDMQVNGTAVPQKTSTAGTAAYTTTELGKIGTNIGDVYVDDIIIADYASYPIGEHVCQYLAPTSDGTHNNAANAIEDQDGNDIDGTTYTAYDKINSVPTSAPGTSTYLRQATTGTTRYAEVNFGDMVSGGTPLGVMAFIAYTSQTTEANQAAAYAYDGVDSFTIWGSAATPADYSDGSLSSLYYKSAVVGTVTSEATVNALKLRFGNSNDVIGNPYLVDSWLVVPYKSFVASGTVAVTPAEGNQAQAGDAATVRATYSIAPAQGDQVQVGDAATVRATYSTAPAEGNQAQAGDVPTVRAGYVVTFTEGNQTQTGDIATVSFATFSSVSVTPGDGFQAQAGDTATVSAGYPVAPVDGFQTQTMDIATLATAVVQTPRQPVILALDSEIIFAKRVNINADQRNTIKVK